ncbi:MAG: HD domain-containing protein [Chloroflexi bacterium]|nr:HD domain-containing protein [Chloroflexota bacterium]
MSDWLTHLREDLIAITTTAAREHWSGPTHDAPPYFNYRFEHVRQVERDALSLLETVGGDEEVVLASVWLHDRFKPQYGGDHHALRAAEWASAHLASYNFPVDKIARVEFAVANHSNPPRTLPDNEHDARVLWDADKLSKIGPSNMIAFLLGASAFPHKPNTYPSIAQRLVESLSRDETGIDAFYFEPSRAWANERVCAKRAFCAALLRELEPR